MTYSPSHTVAGREVIFPKTPAITRNFLDGLAYAMWPLGLYYLCVACVRCRARGEIRLVRYIGAIARLRYKSCPHSSASITWCDIAFSLCQEAPCRPGSVGPVYV